MCLIFLDDVEQMFLDLDHSASQIGLQGIFGPLNFHSVDVEVESFVLPRLLLIFHPLGYFTVFCVDFSANALNEGMLIWQKFWRHLFLSEKLFHLNGAHVQFAIILFLLEPIDKRVVEEVDILVVFD